jgi:hypothetical protein
VSRNITHKEILPMAFTITDTQFKKMMLASLSILRGNFIESKSFSKLLKDTHSAIGFFELYGGGCINRSHDVLNDCDFDAAFCRLTDWCSYVTGIARENFDELSYGDVLILEQIEQFNTPIVWTKHNAEVALEEIEKLEKSYTLNEVDND